ncbi:spore germination protein [Clostridium bovifaecis]|uniref:Spore germination protein n=1 Tax=Clostridium bovifaecis TaxID=2184719 RepID=A0A6I6EPE0_9CLOT|nr:spore germination protein [Clostridium bovifaecis]
MNKKYVEYIREKLKDSFDVQFREIQAKEGKIYAIFIDNLVDKKYISEYIIWPLMESNNFEDVEAIKSKILYASVIGDAKDEQDAIKHILSGDVVLIFDFFESIIFCETKSIARRAIGENTRESVIKGPHEAFNELIVDNIALIRKRIKNENLKFEIIKVGKKSNTTTALAYIKGVAPDRLVDYVRSKIESTNLEFVLEVSYIEESLRSKGTIFDTVDTTERPDKVASKLFEGKIAVLVDGTPEVVTAPFFFIENFIASDDYYFNKYFADFIRIQRWIAFFLALLLPGIYIAIGTHHFSLIPTTFVFRLAVSRAGVPFPTVVEVLLMSFFFQLLREAGVRLPQPTGQTMGIVGALILGDAAIGAGLASQGTIVIVAVASISTFLVPNLYKNIAVWNIIIVLFSAFLGLPGFYMGFFIFLAHLAALETCGYPYLYPLGTLELFKYKDIILRGDLNKISNSMFQKDDSQ